MGFDIHGIDGLMKELGALEVERVAPAMLKESVPILEKSVKKHAVKHEDTGDLIESVKKTGAQRNQNGYYICVRPTGKDRKGVRNMEKMAALEYGVDGKQPATPVLTPAVKEVEVQVLMKMQEVFNREVKL
ncbi:hypothetical protein [Blautia argi]|uniref:hypothetical protein n=1 Tax=Blautia argi TaxID=1912897 RepID=UPI002942EAA3|nr:hypothetical protein [Blautia argi]